MKSEVLVSVIMPAYNCGKYICQSIDSVLKQTVNDWEIRIVDDCSTDDTSERIRPYLEQYPNKIFYTRLEKNGGPAVARTEAIRQARGKYIAFFDSDDLWMPEKLDKQIRFMEENGALFSATAYEQMDDDGNSLGCVCYPPDLTDYKKMLLLSNPIGNTTVMYDRSVLGKYEVPPIKKRNDFALWLKILRDTEYCYGINENLALYRVRNNSVSSNKLAQAKYHWQLYRKIEGFGVFRSAFYMLCWAFVKGTGFGLKKERNKNRGE